MRSSISPVDSVARSRSRRSSSSTSAEMKMVQAPVELELEDADAAVPADPVDLRPERAVPLVRDVLDPFEELAVLHPLAELLVGEEPVLAPVLLPGAHWSRGRGDRDLELREPLEQRADQRALAGAGRPGDDEDGLHAPDRRDVGSPPAERRLTDG